MKKFLALILAVVSVFCFASCSLGTPKSKEGEKIVKYFRENATEIDELKELYLPSPKMIKTGDGTYFTATSRQDAGFKMNKFMKYYVNLYRYVKLEDVKYVSNGVEYTTSLFLSMDYSLIFYGAKANDFNPNINNGETDLCGTTIDGTDVKCKYNFGEVKNVSISVAGVYSRSDNIFIHAREYGETNEDVKYYPSYSGSYPIANYQLTDGSIELTCNEDYCKIPAEAIAAALQDNLGAEFFNAVKYFQDNNLPLVF